MAASSVSFSGLSSGLDTASIIDSLIAVDSQPLTRLKTQLEGLNEKNDAYTSMNSYLLELDDIAYDLRAESSLKSLSASSSDEDALAVSVSSSAEEGNYSLTILNLAKAETLSSDSFEDSDTQLGSSGEFLINGVIIEVNENDSLKDIRNSINNADAAVSATILRVRNGDYRLMIASDEQGEDGFTLGNVGDSNVLESLGITDGTDEIREISNGNVLSNSFESGGSTIGSLYDLSGDISGTVTIRDTEIEIDFSTDSLTSISEKINNANITGVAASVEQAEDEDGNTYYKLAISGTQNFADDNNVLETLGILTGGTSGTRATFETGTLYVDGQSGEIADEGTPLGALGTNAPNGEETVTVRGYSADGTEVNQTITVNDNTTVGELLDAIEGALGGDVTANMVDGKITVQSAASGETDLSVSIMANNENGGTLDFGTITNTILGRDRVVVEGTDARIVVNNIEISRSSNEIDDIITGVTLKLKDADEDTTLNVTVEQDMDAVFTKIQELVDAYNTLVEYVNDQSDYVDEDGDGKEDAGPLQGDSTTRSVVERLQQILNESIGDDDATFNQLAEIGVALTTEGTLDIDTSALKDALNEDFESVISIFTVSRTSSDNDISFVYSSTKTKAGTYDVEITQAAEQAQTQSAVIGETLGEAGIFTVTDNKGSTLEVEYTADMTASQLSALINAEAETKYSRIIESNRAFLDSAGDAATQNTAIGDISGVEIAGGDTIKVAGTNSTGKTYNRVITLTADDTHTMSDILEAIEESTDNEVNASIDADGRIVIQELDTGSSEMAFSITSTVSGLDFGEFDVVQEGRGVVTVNAAVTDDNRLQITQEYYGSEKTFSVSGGGSLGISDETYAGIDVAGYINGYEASGSGKTLNASAEDENTSGITLVVNLTAEELAKEGASQGAISLVSGIADSLYNTIEDFTDTVDGFVQVGIDSLEVQMDSLEDRIDTMENRIEQRREMYTRRFTQMEIALARLETLQQTLTSSLGTTSTIDLLSG